MRVVPLERRLRDAQDAVRGIATKRRKGGTLTEDTNKDTKGAYKTHFELFFAGFFFNFFLNSTALFTPGIRQSFNGTQKKALDKIVLLTLAASAGVVELYPERGILP